MANECLREWLEPLLLILAFFKAAFMPSCRNCSLRWWRFTRPDRGSTERFMDGNTYCQPRSLSAFGYFRDNAYGIETLP